MIERPIFIGGMPRSGTTLLRVMLDSHPNIACGPELRVIPTLAQFSAQLKEFNGPCLEKHYSVTEDAVNGVFQELIASFLEPYAAQRDCVRIAEKTPANVLHFAELFHLFPDCQCIHMIRDGRDVIASLLQMGWNSADTGAPMEITRNVATAADSWVSLVSRGRQAKDAELPIYEIRYEHLIEEPELVLRRLLKFLDEPWNAQMLAFENNPTIETGIEESSAAQVSKPLYKHSVGRWREMLSQSEKEIIKRHAGDLLIELGYADGNDW